MTFTGSPIPDIVLADGVTLTLNDDDVNKFSSISDGANDANIVVVVNGDTSVDLSSITTTGTNTLRVDTSAEFLAGATPDASFDVDVANGQLFTLSATDADIFNSIAAVGSGSTHISALDTTLNADLSTVSSTSGTVTAAFDVTNATSFSGDLGTAVVTVADNVTMKADYSSVSGATINQVSNGALDIQIDSTSADLKATNILGDADKTAEFITDMTFTGDLGTVATTIIASSDITMSSAATSENALLSVDGTLAINAADINGGTIDGSGVTTVSNLQDSLNEDFTNVTTTTLNVSWQDDTATFMGDLVNVDTLNVDSGVMSAIGDLDSANIVVDNLATLTIDTSATMTSGTLTDNGTLNIDAADIVGKTVAGNGTLNVKDLQSTLNADLETITDTSITTKTVEWLSGTGTFSGKLDDYDLTITAGTMTLDATADLGTSTIIVDGTLEASAAQLTSESISGSGTIAVTDLDATPTADLSGLTSTTLTALYDTTNATSFSGNLGNAVVTVADGVTMKADFTSVNGVSINKSGSGTNDGALNIQIDSALANLTTVGGNADKAADFITDMTFTGVLGTVSTTILSGVDIIVSAADLVSTNIIDTDANDSTLTITGTATDSDYAFDGLSNSGAGTIALSLSTATTLDLSDNNLGGVNNFNVSNAGASITLNSSQLDNTMSVAGSGSITVDVVAGGVVYDLSTLASTLGTDKLIINDGTGSDTISTGSSAEVINLTSGGTDNVNAGAGADTINISNTTLGTINGEANDDNFDINATGTYTGTLNGGSENDSLTISGSGVDITGLTLTSIENIIVTGSVVMSDAQLLSLGEANVTGAGDITLEMNGNSEAVDLSSLATSGTKVLNVVNSGTFVAGATPDSSFSVTIEDGATLTLSAADADLFSGISATGSGSTNITALDATLDADLSTISSTSGTVVAGFDNSGIFIGNLGDAVVTVANNQTFTANETVVDGKNLTGGVGSIVEINGAASGASVDIGSITTSKLTVAESISGSLTINNATIDVDASSITTGTKAITINTDQLDQNFTGGAGSDTVVTSGTGAYTGTLSSIENFDNTNAVSFTADKLSGETIEFSGAAITIVDLDLNATADLSGLTAANAATITIDIDNNVTFSGTLDTSNAITFDLSADNVTLTSTAAKLDGKTVTDSANTTTVEITALDASLGAQLQNINADSVTAAFDNSGVFTGNLGNAVVSVANAEIMSTSLSIADSKFIGGAGKLELNSGSGNFNAINVSAAAIVLATALGASVTLNSVVTSVDAAAHAENVTINVADSLDFDTKTVSFSGGTGSDVLNVGLASSEGITSNVTVDGNINDFNVELLGSGTSNIDATNINATITLTGGNGGDATLTNVSNDVGADAFASGENLDVTLTNTDATISTGAGTNVIDALALDATKTLTLDGTQGGDTTVQIDEADIAASGTTDNLTVDTAGNFDNNITTGSGDDNVEGSQGTDVINMTSGTDTLDFSNIGTAINATETTVAGTNVNTSFSNVDNLVGASGQDDTYTVDFANINNLVFDGNTNATSAGDTVALTGSGSTTVSDTQFDNIENLDIIGLNTGNTLDITYDNLKAWSESGATEFTISVNETLGTIDVNNQFQQVDNNGTTNITTTGDYVFTNGTPAEDITLHVV